MATVPVWPPASVPCASISSTPAATASRAASALCTCAETTIPASRSGSTSCGRIAPKDSDTSAGTALMTAVRSSGRSGSAQAVSPTPNRSRPPLEAISAC
jgi:hypothetical protein